MQTKRSFKPIRALIGLGMMAVGSGVIAWELFVHEGRIRIMGLLACVLVGIVGGALVLFRSLAKVCARCETEIGHLELAFPPELFPIVEAYAKSRGAFEALLGSRRVSAEDRERAILQADGCSTCRAFSHVSAHYAVWNSGGFFDAKRVTSTRAVAGDEAPVLVQLVESRIDRG